MRIILKPAGTLVVVIAFGTLIGLLALRDHRSGTGASTELLPAANASQAKTDTVSENLLQNAGFEGNFRPLTPSTDKAVLNGTTAMPWNDDSAWAHVNATYSPDHHTFHSGTCSQKIEVLSVKHSDSALDTVQFVQRLVLTRGTHYSAGIWVRADRQTTIYFMLRQAGPPFTTYGTQEVAVGTKWQQIKLDAEVTQEGDSFLMLNAGTPATLWVDDANLSRD